MLSYFSVVWFREGDLGEEAVGDLSDVHVPLLGVSG